MMRESLRSLVMLAKSEQMLEIRQSSSNLARGFGNKLTRATHIAP